MYLQLVSDAAYQLKEHVQLHLCMLRSLNFRPGLRGFILDNFRLSLLVAGMHELDADLVALWQAACIVV
jgi:hypothetical protein